MSLLIRTLILWDQGPTLMTLVNLNYFLILNTFPLGVRDSTDEFERDIIQSIALCVLNRSSICVENRIQRCSSGTRVAT